MKTISNILATTIVALFLLSFGMKSEAVGACDPGWSSKSILMEVAPGSGCVFSFDICYKCSPVGLGATKVEFETYPILEQGPGGCTPNVTYENVINYILGQFQSPAFVFSELCIPAAIPPCEGSAPKELVTFSLPQCWQAEVILYFGEKTVYYSPCTEDYCEVTYEYCRDQWGELQKSQHGTQIGGIPSCTTEAWEIPDYPDFNDLENQPLNNPTDCYIYHTPCNP